MKFDLRAIFLSLFVMLFAQSVGAGQQDFSLVNQTGVEIYRLYVSPAGSDEWQEDVLSEDVLPHGATVNISFDNREVVALWDIRIEDEDGNALEWEDINLLKASVVTLQANGIANIE